MSNIDIKDVYNERVPRKTYSEGLLPLQQRALILEQGVQFVLKAVTNENFRIVRDSDVPPVEATDTVDTASQLARPELYAAPVLAETVISDLPQSDFTRDELINAPSPYDQQAHLQDARQSVTDSAPVPGYPAGYRPNTPSEASDQDVDEFLGDNYIRETQAEDMLRAA
jgi:hypothetical protein